MTIKQIIESYSPFDENEELEKKSFIQFLNIFKEEEIGLRSNLIGHLTASAWITNKFRDSVVMAHHNIYKSWCWLGGHADGHKDMLYVAQKEAKEESGLTNISVIAKNPFDISVINVQPHIRKGIIVPGHLHFNVAYLLEANEEDILIHQPDENSGVKWIKHKNILSEITESDHIKQIYARIIKKIELI